MIASYCAAADLRLVIISGVSLLCPADVIHIRSVVSWSLEWLVEAYVHPSTSLRRQRLM